MSDLLWVALTGGEPLLRKDLDQVVEIFYRRNRTRKFTITTNGILKDASIELLERVLKKIPKAQLMVYFSIDGLPVQLVFFVTSKCNLHCEHCFYLPYLNKAKNELTLDEIEKISKSMSDLLWVALTGGEPLLRKDLDQVVEIFYRRNRTRKFTITTNGILKDASIELLERVLKKIPKAQLMVYFSIDGLPETHDKIRRVQNGFDKTVTTLQAAKELKQKYPNLFVSTITTCTAHNQYEMAPLANKILDEIKPDNMVVNLVRGELEDPSLKNLDISNYHQFINIQQDAIRSGRLGYFKFFGKKLLLAKEARQKEIITDVFVNNRFVTPCYAGQLSAVLYETGEVAPCEILSVRYGNVRNYNYDFRKLWEVSTNRTHAQNIIKDKCFCTYECALTTNILFNPKYVLKSFKTESQELEYSVKA